MDRRLATLLLLASLAGGVTTGQETGVLFVASDPAGAHRVELNLQGYRPAAVDALVTVARPASVDVRLVPPGIAASFPFESEITVAGGPQPADAAVIHLDGRHSLSREGGAIHVDPVLPGQRLIDALNLATPVFLAFTVIVTAEAVANPPDGSLSLPAAVIASQALCVALLGTDIYLNLRKRRDSRAYTYRVEPGSARPLLDEAGALLAAGDLDGAGRLYRRVAEDYPRSRSYPTALYQLAAIDALSGRADAALAGYREIVDAHPVAELFDRANKAAADVLYARRSYAEALGHLDRIVYLDAFYSRDEVAAYRARILADWAGEDASVLEQAIQAYARLAESALEPDAAAYRRELERLRSAAGSR